MATWIYVDVLLSRDEWTKAKTLNLVTHFGLCNFEDQQTQTFYLIYFMCENACNNM